MKDCLKRQSEIYKGEDRLRCIEPSSDHYRANVDADICHDCPVRKFITPKKPCTPEPIRQPTGTMIQLPILSTPEGFKDCVYRHCLEGGCDCTVTELPVTPEICNRCDEDVRNTTATKTNMLVNYYGAVRDWIKAGRPKRTDEQVKYIFETYCSGCKKYDKKTHSCKVCGCSVNQDSKGLANKLRMATEACPLGMFGADA